MCLPANLTTDDLVHMYRMNEKLKIRDSLDRPGEEKNGEWGEDGFVPLRNARKKGSFAIASDAFEHPIPKALISEEAIKKNIAAKSAAHSSFGSIITLTKTKQWTNSRIILLGVTPLSCELYRLLTRETDTVFLSDPDPSRDETATSTKVPPRAFIPWDRASAPENNCDILVYCSPLCSELNDTTIPSLRCKAVIASSDDFLPYDRQQRERALMELEMCPAFRALSSQYATVKADQVWYLDLGAGNGAAARWICNKNKKIHITCIDVCPRQSAENRNLSDEEGLVSQIDVQQGSYERLNSDTPSRRRCE
jgi:hypothetical protein